MGALIAGESEPPLTRKQRRYEPRLTAASYRYFTRGMNSKPMENEVVVRAQRRVQLKAYDKMLKAFRCSPIPCKSGNNRWQQAW